MDENPTLSEAVFNSISEWLAADAEPTMLTGFVLQITGLGEDGLTFHQSVVPTGQSRALSLGLVAVADETIREDLRTDFMLSRVNEEDE